MTDRLIQSFSVGKAGSITLDLYMDERLTQTAGGPARRPYFVATKGGAVVINLRDGGDGGDQILRCAAQHVPGLGSFEHYIRGHDGATLPLTAEQAAPVLAAWREARREIVAAHAGAFVAYKRERAAAILADAGGHGAAADIEANYPGGYEAYERRELAAAGRMDPRHAAEG